ncbi:MAG: transcriptional regulator [Promethearchaeota archaeon]|nr:MAG: transcriptional regulator [Candidatus Lokiarchaeota archaeon]
MKNLNTKQSTTNHKSNDMNDMVWHCLQHDDVHDCLDDCKVHFFLNLFGKKYVMPIIRLLLLHNKLRFNEILGYLKCSPKTLTSRLRSLEQYGLIERNMFKEVPIRVEYSLGERGNQLGEIFERIAQWALNEESLEKNR